MDIRVQDIITINNAKIVESIEDIKKAKRLFYELGHHPEVFDRLEGVFVIQWEKWNREGIFKEIVDIKDMIKNDEYLTNPEYLKHHNFVYI